MPQLVYRVIKIFGIVGVVSGVVILTNDFFSGGSIEFSASIFDVVNTVEAPSLSTDLSSSSFPVEESVLANENLSADAVETVNIVSADRFLVTEDKSAAPAVPLVTPGFVTINSPIGPLSGGTGGGGFSSQAGFIPVAHASENNLVATTTASSSVEFHEPPESTPESPTSTQAVAFLPLALCELTPEEPSLVSAPTHLIIDRLFIDMEGSDTGEFVEIYNPTDSQISLSDWSLQYLSGSASSLTSITKKNFPEDEKVDSKGYYRVGMGKFSGMSDMRWSQSLNNVGATVFLVQSQDILVDVADPHIVDRVGYGAGLRLMPETSAALLPPIGSLIERMRHQDSDNNAVDFMVRSFIGSELSPQ